MVQVFQYQYYLSGIKSGVWLAVKKKQKDEMIKKHLDTYLTNRGFTNYIHRDPVAPKRNPSPEQKITTFWETVYKKSKKKC